MKILHISTSALNGGAARAAYRIHEALLGQGIDSWFYTLHRETHGQNVLSPDSTCKKAYAKIAPSLESLPFRFLKIINGDGISGWYVPGVARTECSREDYDIIHLHGIDAGMLSVADIGSIKKPIVWTLHDMAPFTGGCHYANECEGYLESCNACPQLSQPPSINFTKWIHQWKYRRWQESRMKVVTPSKWLGKLSSKSAIIGNKEHHVIPYPLSGEDFKMIPKRMAREILGWERDRPVILFGSSVGMANPRKGGQFLLPAVSKIMALMDSIIPQIYVFGGSQGSLQMHDGVSIKNLGHLSDNISLSLIYSAADVFLAPSLYDNLPNTVLESLACGTPVVGFNIGGLPDVITHQVNGYLATPYSVDDISYGLTWALTRDFTNQSEEIRRNLMKICDPHSVAASYKSLYESFVK